VGINIKRRNGITGMIWIIELWFLIVVMAVIALVNYREEDEE